ncbi:AAC(3) family N-acetyltransferase [Parapedomonas caeni]
MSMAGAFKRLLKQILLPPVEAMRRRRRQHELKSERVAVSQTQLAAAIAALPLHKGGVVLVHSSLKSLGYVEGGAEAVVEALVDGIVKAHGGTVMLPTFSIDGTMYNTLKSGRAFDVRSTPSNLGALPEAFRRHPLAVRSVHPSHSFAAIGPEAAWLTEAHHLARTNFGDDTPMARMLARPSQLLGLGTNLGNVTFYHVLEDREAFPFPVYAPDGPFAVDCTDRAGVVHHLSLNAHQPGELPMRRIDHRTGGATLRALYTAHMEARGVLSWHQVGEARSWLVDANSFYREVKALMEEGLTVYADEAGRTAFASRHGMTLPSAP